MTHPQAESVVQPGRTGLASLLTVEILAEAATRISQIAVPWLVLTETGSALQAGLVGTAEIAPFVMMQILGGPIVDRVGSRRIMLWANMVAGVCFAAIPVLHAIDELVLPVVLATVIVAGFCRGPAEISSRVLLPTVCRDAKVPIDRGAALVDGASRTALLLGAPAAGILIGVWGASTTVWITAGALIAASLISSLVPDRAAEAIAPQPFSHIAAELKEGLLYIAKHRLMRSLASMVFVSNLADAALTGLLLLLWVRLRFDSAANAGVLLAVMGGGAVIGTMVVAARGHRLPRHKTFAVAFLIAGAPRFFVLVVPLPFAAVIAVWAVCGIAAGAINPIIAATQYDTIPSALQARVLGAVTALAWTGVPFGALIGGSLVAMLGLTTTLTVFGIVYFIATLDPFLRRAWVDMNRRTD